jgi:hypothetical protein
MLRLSRSLTDAHVHRCLVLLNGQRYAPALTHPGDAEAADAAHTYRVWLWSQLQQPHTRTYKDLLRLTRAHQQGGTVVVRVHENARHGEVILAALRYLAGQLPPSAPTQPQRQQGCSAHFLPDLEAYELDELLDASCLVWVVGKQVTHLGYLWDVEGVYTALVPDHGLVKLDRLGEWHRLRYRQTLSPTVRRAHVELTAHIEQVFTPLIRRQQAQETTDIAATHLPYLAHGVAASRLAYEQRYDPWDLAPEAQVEPPVDPAQQAHELAVRQALKPPGQRPGFSDLLPTSYRGEHVKPVIKTKPDGSRWVLTAEMQARGALHLYQPLP